MNAAFFSIGSVMFVSAMSLVGIFFLSLGKRRLERMLFVLVSFAVGALIGDVFIHILPEIAEANTDFESVSLLILLGILLSFALEKLIRWHHCHDIDCDDHHKTVGTMTLVG